MKLGVWGWEGSVEGAQSPPPPTILGCCRGEGPQPELFHAEASLRLQERSMSGGLAAGRIRELEGALRDWHPRPLRGPAQGQDCRSVGSCSFLLPSTPRAFPAQGSPAAATRADGSRGLHGNTDVTGLES